MSALPGFLDEAAARTARPPGCPEHDRVPGAVAGALADEAEPTAGGKPLP